jgi:phage terminase large subunit
MDVVFSDKYQSLFELLEAKEQSENNPKSEKWKELHKVDTVCISGGRDAGKSYASSIFDVVAAAQYNHRILSTRYTMTSTDNSITKALDERMELLGKEGSFDFSGNTYSCIDGKGYIAITGQKTSSGNQTAKLKSLEGFSIFKTDEAEELKSYEEWVKIKRSMRATDVQCLSMLIFNPPTREHWIAKKFYEGIPDGFNGIKNNVLYIHTTYLDNGKENMAEHNWNEYEALRLDYEEYLATNPSELELLPNKIVENYKEYKHAVLGGFKEKAEGVVYPLFQVAEFPKDMEYIFGLDFGSNDPDALTRVAVNHSTKSIYIKEEFFSNNVSVDGLLTILIDRCGYSDSIVADAAERRLINDFYNEGVNIKKAYKQEKHQQIKHLKGWNIFIDPESFNVIKAFNNYRWHDEKAGIILHDWSDLMDSWRYAAYDLIKPTVVML